MDEQVIQRLPRRCPYCDGILPDRDDMPAAGEERETCPHCGKRFIRMGLERAAETVKE